MDFDFEQYSTVDWGGTWSTVGLVKEFLLVGIHLLYSLTFRRSVHRGYQHDVV